MFDHEDEDLQEAAMERVLMGCAGVVVLLLGVLLGWSVFCG